MIDPIEFVKEYCPNSYGNFERYLFVNNKDIHVLMTDQSFSTYKYFEELPLEFQIGLIIKYLISRSVNMKDILQFYDGDDDFETNFRMIIIEGFKRLELDHGGRTDGISK